MGSNTIPTRQIVITVDDLVVTRDALRAVATKLRDTPQGTSRTEASRRRGRAATYDRIAAQLHREIRSPVTYSSTYDAAA